jgi:hypothetical protein
MNDKITRVANCGVHSVTRVHGRTTAPNVERNILNAHL